MKKAMFVVAAILAGTSLSAWAVDAKTIWEKECAKCHGADGKGETKMGKKLKMKDYSDAKVQAEMKDPDMVKIIKEGKMEEGKTRMKAFKDLTNDEVKSLVAHVRKLKK